MPETKNNSKNDSYSLDWLFRGVLTKLGDIFDGLTGRKWQPSSSLATSELIERLKKLLDSEVKDLGSEGKFVPHNLKLKMQWDKFSTDSEKSLKKLENELLIAAVDHINDNRYQTYQPLKLEVKPDYFTEGVKLLASFDQFGEEDREAAVNVTVPQIQVGDFVPEPEVSAEPEKTYFVAEFALQGKQKQIELAFTNGKRFSVGRMKQNDLTIEDNSVSKTHASLALNKNGELQVADTGSTNGTFINERRIAYGKAFPVPDGGKVKFGTVEVLFYRQKNEEEEEVSEQQETAGENYGKTEVLRGSEGALPTAPSIDLEEANYESLKKSDQEDAPAVNNYVTNKDVVPPTEQNIVLDFEEKK